MTDGLGVDLEDLDALARFGGTADHLARRWLDRAEQAWCRRQGHPAPAFVVAWCCREAAFKAAGGLRSPCDVRLRLAGTLARGRAGAYLSDTLVADVRWRTVARHVIAVAAGPAHAGTGLLDRLLSLTLQEDVNADSGDGRNRLHRDGAGTAAAWGRPRGGGARLQGGAAV